MTIKQQGGIFGRNPTFNNVEVDGEATLSSAKISDLTNDRVVIVGTGGEIEDDANLTWDGSQFNISNGTVTLFVTQGSSANAMRIGVGGNVSAVLEHRGYAGQNFLIQDETVASITAAGNLAFTSGRGIDFSATSGTGTSELFDDYEEGDFTPTLFYGGTEVGYYSRGGRYTKIGHRVFCSIQFYFARNAGAVTFGGLPFTSGTLVGSPDSHAGTTGRDYPTSTDFTGYVNSGSTGGSLNYSFPGLGDSEIRMFVTYFV